MFTLNLPHPMSRSLRVLATLLAYPDAQMRHFLPRCAICSTTKLPSRRRVASSSMR